MPTQDQTTNINNAVAQLRSAEVLLLQAGRQTADDTTLIKINNEYCLLDTILSQLVSAAAAADDATFKSATSDVKAQADALDKDEASIKKIVSNVETAAKIAGYVAQAAQYIAMI